MVELARDHGIRVILGSIPPTARFPWRPEITPAEDIVAMNAWLRAYAKRQQLLFVDYHSALSEDGRSLRPALSDDGVHPNAAGYAAMRPLIDAALERE
jgi:lysophospholipase L1-like esterase